MMNGVGVLSSRLNAGRLDVRTGVRTTLRQSGMDSNVQFRALDRQRIRSSWGRSTGAPVIRAVAGLGIPIDLSGGGPRSRHSPPGSGGVTPGLRCRRCERIAEPMVRIRSPPADSPSLTGSNAPRSRGAAFRAGVRAMGGGAVGRDGDRPAIWRLPATMSLLGQIPVPQCQ
jgi:hypothetical protein